MNYYGVASDSHKIRVAGAPRARYTERGSILAMVTEAVPHWAVWRVLGLRSR